MVRIRRRRYKDIVGVEEEYYEDRM